MDDFDWSNDGVDDPSDKYNRRYFFYTMLYRKFDFLKEFDKLKNQKFADKYDNIKFFGIDNKTKDEVGNQIRVLFYNSKDDFALLINTKTNDEDVNLREICNRDDCSFRASRMPKCESIRISRSFL